MIKWIIITVITDFLALLFNMDAVSFRDATFNSVLNLAQPYIDTKILAIKLVLHLFIDLVFASAAENRVDTHFKMQSFEYRAGSRARLFMVQNRDVLFCITEMLCAKCAVDIMFCRSISGFSVFLYIEMNFLLTVLIWAQLIFFLRLYGTGRKMVRFIIIVIIMISTVLSVKTGILPVFSTVIGTDVIGVKATTCKVIVLLLLLLISYISIQKKDLTGDITE